MSDTKERGLYGKYNVERVDGKPLKGDYCIVLEFGDPIARVAIRAWANEMRRNGYKQVYEDVIDKLVDTSDVTFTVGERLWLDDGQGWEVLAVDAETVTIQQRTHDGPPTNKPGRIEERAMRGLKRYFEVFPQYRNQP